MFGIGGTELIIILIFVFLVVGPEKLPEVATTIGKAIRKFQDAQSQVSKVIKDETEDIKAAVNADSKAKPSPVMKGASKPAAAAKEAPAAAAAPAASEAASEEPAATADSAEEKPLSFSERKALYQRQRKEAEEAAKNAAANGKEA